MCGSVCTRLDACVRRVSLRSAPGQPAHATVHQVSLRAHLCCAAGALSASSLQECIFLYDCAACWA